MDYQDHIKSHLFKNWQIESNICYWDKGPAEKLPYDFRILEFPPTQKRSMWKYATCCMSQKEDDRGLELHIFSSKQDPGLIELLTATAFYHRTSENLDVSHTINFGRSWQGNSKCTYGFISLPYLDGPTLENMMYRYKKINFYWLIPITKAELEFVKANGADALEEQFENVGLDYLNSNRLSVL